MQILGKLLQFVAIIYKMVISLEWAALTQKKVS